MPVLPIDTGGDVAGQLRRALGFRPAAREAIGAVQPADLAATLAALHDIVVPAPVPWWPPAPGWYAVLALAVALAGWGAWRLYRRWRANAYRRTALRRLAAIRAALAVRRRRAAALTDLATLLRRAALHVAPRDAGRGAFGRRVARLSRRRRGRRRISRRRRTPSRRRAVPAGRRDRADSAGRSRCALRARRALAARASRARATARQLR